MKQSISIYKIYFFCLVGTLFQEFALAQNNPQNNSTLLDSLSQNVTADEILQTPFGTFNLSRTTGAVFRISGDELRQTPGNNLSEALKGRVPGLRIVRETNVPGYTNYSYTLNGGTPFVLIDGEPRGLEVDLREVDEVIILNDATFNSLLGILGDNGLIYVVTKGGKNQKPVVEVNYQHSINTTTRLPKLLSAEDYANVINRAAQNDGLAPIYSEQAIEAYRTGSDPIRYPNVDYQDTFLEKTSASNFASLGVYGGQENVQYGAFIGYSDFKGIEKIGQPIEGTNLTFRTKIKAKMNDLIQTYASVYGGFIENDRPVLGSGAMFNWISGTPANAFPLKVGDTAYIVSNQFNNNLLAELESGGTRTDYSANMIFDVGLNFDFKDYVPGLKYNTYVMMRTSNSHSLQANSQPETFTIEYLENINGMDSLALRNYQTEFIQNNVSRTAAGIQRTYSYAGNLSYIRDIESGILNLNLNHLLYYQPTNNSSNPDRRQLSFNVNGNYAHQNKYVFFANLNASSSSKYIGSNRTNLFPTAGVAWIASNEDFLKENTTIDFLKLRASYGQVGTEYTANNFFYQEQWDGTGTPFFGIGNGSQIFGFQLGQTPNPDIDWIVYNQFFTGIELGLYKKFSLNINYFNIDINGQVTQAGVLYSDALGSNAFLPTINYTERRNTGFNGNIRFQNNDNAFKYYVGINAGYNKIIGERIAETPFPDQYRLQQGRPEDNIIGLVSDGLFTAENIDSALPQFGEVRIGDIKYADLNGDNVIDSRDQRVIGNNTPRLTYGINAGIKYQGINLDVLGVGVSGYDINLNGMAYYQHFGLGNYFGSVNANLPNGNENPRLSTRRSVNNFRTSDYWLVNGSYFRISNLELGYTFPKRIAEKTPLNRIKVFLKGNNLAVFSKMKDLDPEDPRSGVFEYPMMRNYVIGASFNF